MRLFVAVWPPDDVLDVLAALDRPEIDGLRWTRREQWHITLRFLGEVGDAAEVIAALEQLALAPAPVTLAEKTGRFGQAIVHVTAGGLGAWAAAVTSATADLGTSRPDDRAFHGHITLARVRRGGSIRRADGLPLPPGPRSWVATEVCVVRSHLRPSGAEYETVASVAVKG